MAEVTREMFEEMRDNTDSPPRKFTVVTGSMIPLIPIGAEVIVDIGREPKRFDVVAFWGGDRLICHVLWHINHHLQSGGERVYLTCALRGDSVDLSIKHSDYLGAVINYRLNVWNKLKLAWKLRKTGL